MEQNNFWHDCLKSPYIAVLISPPGDIGVANQFTSSHTHSHTHIFVFYVITYCPCDIWLLVMCYFCSRPVASVSLSILTETGQSSTPAVIQTQSQVFWLPAPCSSSSSSSSSSAYMFSEPAAKRSKQHYAGTPNDLNTCRVAVTAVTRLTPLLNSGCVKCRVMLHYVQRQDAFALVSNPTPVVLHCGQFALDIHSDFQTRLLKNPDLKTGKITNAYDLRSTFWQMTVHYCLFLFFFCTDEVKEDLLSLMAVLDRWVFHIDSPEHSLGNIDSWIQKRVGCKRVEVSPQYLLLNSSGPSALMLLHWHQITPFQGELSVHSR